MDNKFVKALEGMDINNLTDITFTSPKIEFLQPKKYINKEILILDNPLSNDYFKKTYEKRKAFYEKK